MVWHVANRFLLNRSEASTIPHLLVAANEPNEDTNATGLQALTARTSQHTFYQDGAWVAIDEGYGVTYDDDYEPDDPDPKDLYHKQLVKRFETLRHTLSRCAVDRTSRPDADIERSSSGKPPSNRHEWLYTIDREYPTRSHICRLDEKSVRRGLEYCAHAMNRFETISSQKSCWIWTLLALSGDIGTLDSQKMSHIRDLGNKAGEMSVSLHSGSARRTQGPEGDSLHTDLADDEQCGDSEAAFCDAGVDGRDSEKGYVQSRVSEDLYSEAEKMHNEAVSKSQHNPHSHVSSSGTSDILIDVHESTNTDTNDDTLERARARLLAQLGDNLVQAGIPTSVLDTDDTHPHILAQPDQGSDESQHEIKIRAIPSRAEAERQRQLMRAQDSATASSRETNPSSTKSSVESDNSSGDIDLNTRITIDMILTVVAECYGQRDLLEFRKPW